MTAVLVIGMIGIFCATMACGLSGPGGIPPIYLLALAANVGVVLLASAALLEGAR